MKRGAYRIGFVQIVRDFQNMPKTMIELAFVQFFSWFALFAMWIYTTSGITSHTYDMKLSPIEVAYFKNILQFNDISDELKADQVRLELDKHAEKIAGGEDHVVVSFKLVKLFLDHSDELTLLPERTEKLENIQKEYNDGADWVGILFAMYNGFAALAAIFLPFIVRITSRKVTHMIMLVIGGVGLLSFYFIKDPNLLLLSMVGVGCAWASILAIPYAMLSSSLPAEKMGYYMGIFNFFIVIPQIVAASILGFLVIQFFQGEFIYALVIGGASMILAGFLSLRVHDHEEVEVKKQLDT
jgi:maltose/moltooligosaccharide transporter